MPSLPVNTKTDDLHKKPRKDQTSVLNFFATTSSAPGDDENTAIDLTEHNNNPSTDSAVEQPIGSKRKIATDANKKQDFSIYCDLDGVLVDFNEGVKRLNRGKGADMLSRKQLWGSIARADNFFLNLPWTKDGKVLWSKIVESGYCPSILTGIPFIKGSREQKFSWCERELRYVFDSSGKSVIFNHVDYASPRNEHERKSGSMRKGKNIVNVITCWSQNKHFESGPLKVLIDDREELGLKWAQKGGIFIHHVTAEGTIAAMVERGILPMETETKGAKKRRANLAQGHRCEEDVICIDE